MRLFIAIELSRDMKDALVTLQDQMRFQRISGNYTPVENPHLTLAFIGDYPAPDDVILPDFNAFELRLSGYDCFGDLWWVGIGSSPDLEGCVRRLRRRLAESGIPFDKKRFTPHITLARRTAGQPALSVPDMSMRVDHISLMRSERGRHGMIYTELKRQYALDIQDGR